jgi:hypothetical protein
MRISVFLNWARKSRIGETRSSFASSFAPSLFEPRARFLGAQASLEARLDASDHFIQRSRVGFPVVHRSPHWPICSPRLAALPIKYGCNSDRGKIEVCEVLVCKCEWADEDKVVYKAPTIALANDVGGVLQPPLSSGELAGAPSKGE